MKKQKKNFKTIYQNSMFSKREFYIKFSIILLIATIFTVTFLIQNGELFFESYPYVEKFRGDDFQVHIIDVGNGDAMLIKFPNDQTMMIDTGDDYYENKVKSYVQQYLWSENLNQIDYLVLTHPDSDHVGCAKTVFKNFSVKNLYRPKIYSKTEYQILDNKENYKTNNNQIYDDAIMSAYNENCNIIFNEAGLTFKLGGASVEFLSPTHDTYSNSNNYSAVIKISYKSKTFLFMGDAETEVEDSLIKKNGDNLKADVLKVGHHGSYTSTSEEFVKLVNPEYAILSCDASENYPHEDVIANLRLVNAKTLSTGVRGSFAIAIKSEKIIFANAEKPSNYWAILFSIFLLISFIVWKNPFNKIKPMIKRIKND